MAPAVHAGFRIKNISDGSLYRARVERNDGEQFQVNGRVASAWETPQCIDKDAAERQAIFAIDCGKIRL
jgi:hypothetical protein